MPHPVANHPVLSKTVPDLVEQVLAHTTAVLMVPEVIKQKTLDLARSVLLDRLLEQGMSKEEATVYADVAKAAVASNVASLDNLAKQNGMTVQQLLFISTQVNNATMDCIEEALSRA